MIKRQKRDKETINHVKSLQLGKVGKSMQGQCEIKQGKVTLINRDKTIKTVWED